MEHIIIEMEKTGQLLKTSIKEAGYDVKYIQEYLHLACLYTIYRWYKGKTLPSVDHFYSLSILLDKHIENLIVRKISNKEDYRYFSRLKRTDKYRLNILWAERLILLRRLGIMKTAQQGFGQIKKSPLL